MALDSPLAKLLHHIAAVHSADLPGDRLVFRAGPHQIGFLHPELAARLAALEPGITVTADTVTMPLALLPKLNQLAASLGIPPRHENFDIREAADSAVLGLLDRGALPSFGVIGVGVHLNGLLRRADGWHVWIGKRAADKKLDPGKLDNLVAGGVPAGLSPFETLLKEGEEEASLPEAVTRNARQVARFSYNMEREEGLRRDVVYVYDLELPEDFHPHPADGEVEHFELWSLPRVLEVLATTDDFKFNVALVLIDLLIRFGVIEGEAAATLRAALAS
ncbi:NUDIX hydrolase [Acidocella sp.]|jgi:8-oxo-dGTP pyrophosphatase MutT (NUDIX family)|uniref:NUDIX hydrolase n=1 Tax=Acidocella sp. TaxID=50710 RepID=UPI002F3FD917